MKERERVWKCLLETERDSNSLKVWDNDKWRERVRERATCKIWDIRNEQAGERKKYVGMVTY